MKEDFPHKNNTELTREQLENLVKIKIDPQITLTQLLSAIKGGGYAIRFLVTDNYNLYLSTNEHERLVLALGVDREDCLLQDGTFVVQKTNDKTSNEVVFSYSWGGKTKIRYVKNTAEEKIAGFLKSNGIEISHTIHE